jgi:hypothetical protein
MIFIMELFGLYDAIRKLYNLCHFDRREKSSAATCIMYKISPSGRNDKSFSEKVGHAQLFRLSPISFLFAFSPTRYVYSHK